MPARAQVKEIPLIKGEDSSYRYKMPQPICRSQSQGNGLKTGFVNANKVANAIGRTTSSLTQFFSFALGTGCRDSPKGQEGQILLNGGLDRPRLEALIYEFVEAFVLCPLCKNPETVYTRGSSGELCLSCRSCGANTAVAPRTGTQQKLADWVVAHFETESRQQNATSADTPPETPATDNEEAAPAPAPVPVAAAPTPPLGRTPRAAPAADAVYLNVEDLSALMAEIVNIEDEEAFVNRITAECAGDTPDSTIFTQLKDYWERVRFNLPARLAMLIVTVLPDPALLLDVIRRRRSLLIRVLMEPDAQREFLYFMSRYLCAEHPNYFTSAPIVFYTLFDNEICEEEAFKAWEKRASSRFEKDKAKATELRRIMKPFMKWLDEAKVEEEKDEGGGEEDGEEEDAPEEGTEAPEAPEVAQINIDDI
jgi:translation initiation factor 5